MAMGIQWYKEAPLGNFPERNVMYLVGVGDWVRGMNAVGKDRRSHQICVRSIFTSKHYLLIKLHVAWCYVIWFCA